MEDAIFFELVYIFGLSIIVLLLCDKIKIPPIVGFLLTGVLCGPSALGVVQDMEIVEMLAEIGVIFLLFTIGLELSGDELSRLKKPIFLGGTTQLVLTILVIMGIFLLADQSMARGLLYGSLAALSSTAIVLSILQSRGQTEAPYGRISLSILIFQDLAIVPLMLIIPLFAGDSPGTWLDLLYSALHALALLGGIGLVAKFILPRLMLLVMRTRSRELMLMTVLTICLSVAFLTASVGLSLALGAFLAGLLLAESEYSLNALEGIMPFKEVFTSIFFISVGMLLDINFLFSHLPQVILLALGLILIKALLTFPAVLILKYPMRVAIITSLALAQIGEFSFILAKTGMSYGLMDNFEYQMFLAASILTMSLTPVQIALGPKIANYLIRKRDNKISDDEDDEIEQDLQDHLVIVGFGVNGKHLARTAKDCGIPYIIIEMNPDTVKRYKNEEPIFHGDASRRLVLEHLGVSKARVLAIVVSSDPTALRAIIANARELNPAIHLVVRTRFLGEMNALKELGANDVIPEEFETSIEIFSRVLTQYLIPRQTIDKIVSHIRAENYNILREEKARNNFEEIQRAGIQIAALTIEKNSMLNNKNLEETKIRKKYGVNILAILHNNELITNIDGLTTLHENDTIYILGTPQNLPNVTELCKSA